MRRGISLVAIVGVMALIAAACSNNSSSSGTSGGTSATALSYDPSAQGEGELNLIAWPLYAEKDITQPFENATGCKVNVKEANTSDEMVNLMSQGGGTQYDGVPVRYAGASFPRMLTTHLTPCSRPNHAARKPASER